MGLVIHSKIGRHYFSHGLGALMNKAVDLAKDHWVAYGNFNVTIMDKQINDLFGPRNPDEDFYKGQPIPYYSKELIFESEWGLNAWPPQLEELVIKRKIMGECFVIHQHIMKEYQAKESMLITGNCLGIHLRGTDKAIEHPPVDIQKLFKVIDEYIADYEIDAVFLATDDNKYRSALQYHYGTLVRFDESASVSTNGLPIHHDHTKRMQLNREALSDAYLLSRCKYFAYCNSNLSYLALTIRPVQFTEEINLQE